MYIKRGYGTHPPDHYQSGKQCYQVYRERFHTLLLYVSDRKMQTKSCCIMRWQDTGIGIRKEDQKILFDAFQRVEIDRNRYVEGTGLGLTISQNLVNMMGGVIEVESEYGKGSKFYFTIEQTIVDPTPVSAVNYERAEIRCD